MKFNVDILIKALEQARKENSYTVDLGFSMSSDKKLEIRYENAEEQVCIFVAPLDSELFDYISRLKLFK